MEGILWKWTNYWNGWQTRWFVLENGILSYYKSRDEVAQGCKGSVKVSVCQINVNSTDMTRLSVVIPGQHHMHLKASSPQERQKWLVALGTAKACFSSSPLDGKGIIDNPNTLTHKKSELRLYCDLMMQEVHEVKNLAQGDIDQKKLDEVSSLLSATCDTFIKTLEDIMKMTNSTISSFELSTPPLQPTNGNKASIITKLPKTSITRSQSQDLSDGH